MYLWQPVVKRTVLKMKGRQTIAHIYQVQRNMSHAATEFHNVNSRGVLRFNLVKYYPR